MLTAAVNAFLERYDLLLSAQLGVSSVDVGPKIPAGAACAAGWTGPRLHIPSTSRASAASVPCGFGDDGMPVGLQVVGRRADDALVMRASRAYEAVNPFPMPDLAAIKPVANAGSRT